jgi:SAM-dependent methyltransferase
MASSGTSKPGRSPIPRSSAQRAGPNSPFADAAQFYGAFRPPYAAGAVDAVVRDLDLSAEDRALDLGCGPGTLAIPLSRLVAEVVAVDIDANMVAAGRQAAASAGSGAIEWIVGAAEALSAEAGAFRAAVLGQSFHWVDRDLVLERLGEWVAEGGGIAIFDQLGSEIWEPVVRPVLLKYLGERPRRHPRASPEIPHAPSLLRSAWFHAFTVQEFPVTVVRGVGSVIGCLYSGTGTGRPLFGDRLQTFEEEARSTLLAAEPSGRFESALTTRVILARRAAVPSHHQSFAT